MKVSRRVQGVISLVVVAVVAMGLGLVFVVTAPFHVAFGWISYARRVLPEVTINPGALVTALVTLVALVVTAQLVAARFRPGWPLRWTCAGLGAVVAMFVASIAGAGILHQLGWMLTTPERLIQSSWGRPSMDLARACSMLRVSGAQGLGSAPALRAHVLSSRLADAGERYELHVSTTPTAVLLVPRDPALRAELGARLCADGVDRRIPSEDVDDAITALRVGTSSTSTTTR